MKTIHRFWDGPSPMPADYVDFGRQWAVLNPGWEVKDWNLSEVGGKYLNPEVIVDLYRRDDGRNGIELFVQLADVIGYQLIYQHGGIYVNVDIEPVRSLDHMFDYYRIDPEATAFAPYEDEGSLVVNSVLGGPKGHLFWETVNEVLPLSYWSKPGDEMNQTTGPHLLTNCARQWIVSEGQDSFRVLPQDSFNSVHWKQIPEGGDASGLWTDSSGIIGVHHWGHKKVGRSNYVETATQHGGVV